MPSKIANAQFVPNNPAANNSHSINKFNAKALQKSDNKKCEQFDQVNPIEHIIGIKSSNHHKYVKLGANEKILEYKHSPQKHKSLFAQNSLRIKSNQNKSVNSITKMPRSKTNKATPTRARDTFSDITPSTPVTNTSSNTKTTPSGSLLDAAEVLRFTDTLNKIISKKLLAILTGKDAILKEVRNCVLRDDLDRLKEISPYILSYWRGLSVKHGCVCLDERIAIPKATKDAVLEDIHSTHPGSFAMLPLAQNVWRPYIHRDILAKTSECKACTEIGKNLKSVIRHCKWTSLQRM